MTEPNDQLREQLEQLGFYRNGDPSEGILRASDLKGASEGSTSATRIDRAFKYDAILQDDKLGVTDIFELNGSPCVYFKAVGSEPTTDQLADWHKAAWNHGMARALWVTTPTHIRLFNAFAPPRRAAAGVHDAEVELFCDVADNLELLQNHLFTRDGIASGEFWKGDLGKRIKRKTRIDEQLVFDLTLAATTLSGRGMEPIAAHRLLLRTIFIAYLEAKGILPSALFENLGVEHFEHVLRDPTATKTFFERMRETFNGDLFPPPLKDDGLGEDETDFTVEQLEIPRCVLVRTNLTTFQQSLNFWRYDFDVIPIELISSIYEQFIYAADPESAHRAGTHYTPVNLVDLVLSHIFSDELFGEKNLPLKPKVLDLSCGSGVFLVEAFRRLVARRLASGEKHTRKLVRDTLYEQVFGVDVEETAVEIAAFSLCLTAFELDPDPNATSRLRFERELKGHNLFVGDAFNPDGTFVTSKPFEKKQFSVVVGNPPWTRQKGPRSDTPSDDRLLAQYCASHSPKVTLPYRNPPDQAFVWRASDFSLPNARFGFILEGKRFFSHEVQSIQARSELLRSFAPRMLVNLSALHREDLFPSAQQPAVAVIFENVKPDESESFVCVTLERDLKYRQHGVLRVGPENVHRIAVRTAASNENALKVVAWGSARDLVLVDRLRDAYPSLAANLSSRGLDMFQGYIEGKPRNPGQRTHDRRRPVPTELRGLPCLTGGNLPPFDVDVSTLPKFEEERLEHARDPAIYRGPLLIAGSGLRENRVVASLCHQDVVYSRSYYGVPVGSVNLQLAHYLSGLLNSSLATYLVFLTATHWGVEKYELLPGDFLRIPVPEMGDCEPLAVQRLLQAEKQLRQESRDPAESLIAELDDAVFDLYRIEPWERPLVEDMLNLTIDFQRNHDRSRALEAPHDDECLEYAEALIGVIQPFLTTNRRQTLSAEVFHVDGPLRVAKFRFLRGTSGTPELGIVSGQKLSTVLGRIAASLESKVSDQVYTRRHLRLYCGDTFYVVKPAQRRFWSRSAGMVDADSVLKDLVEGSDGRV
jgi:N-6 DNA Methylase